MKYRVYALMCPVTSAVRYVGVTTLTVNERLRRHVVNAKRGVKGHKENWIRSLECDPIVTLLEETDDLNRECHWIAFYRQLGCDLCNLTDGGEGTAGRRGTRKGHKLSEETKQKIGDANRGRIRSPETKERIRKALQGKPSPKSEEWRRKVSVSKMGHSVSEETRKKIRESLLGRSSPKPEDIGRRISEGKRKAKLARLAQN